MSSFYVDYIPSNWTIISFEFVESLDFSNNSKQNKTQKTIVSFFSIILQISPTFQKFILCHFAFTKELPEYTYFTSRKKIQRGLPLLWKKCHILHFSSLWLTIVFIGILYFLIVREISFSFSFILLLNRSSDREFII